MCYTPKTCSIAFKSGLRAGFTTILNVKCQPRLGIRSRFGLGMVWHYRPQVKSVSYERWKKCHMSFENLLWMYFRTLNDL